MWQLQVNLDGEAKPEQEFQLTLQCSSAHPPARGWPLGWRRRGSPVETSKTHTDQTWDTCADCGVEWNDADAGGKGRKKTTDFTRETLTWICCSFFRADGMRSRVPRANAGKFNCAKWFAIPIRSKFNRKGHLEQRRTADGEVAYTLKEREHSCFSQYWENKRNKTWRKRHLLSAGLTWRGGNFIREERTWEQEWRSCTDSSAGQDSEELTLPKKSREESVEIRIYYAYASVWKIFPKMITSWANPLFHAFIFIFQQHW